MKRSTRVRVKSFDAIVINECTGAGNCPDTYRSFRVSIKDPWTQKHAFWTVIPEQLLEIIE